jgi:hypothetical protein
MLIVIKPIYSYVGGLICQKDVKFNTYFPKVNFVVLFRPSPVTVAERSKACHCLRSLGSRDRGFESHSGHGCLVSVYVRAFSCVCVQVETLR